MTCFADLLDISSVNPEFLVSDPTVFQKRYLKKIRELGEVSGAATALSPMDGGDGNAVVYPGHKPDLECGGLDADVGPWGGASLVGSLAGTGPLHLCSVTCYHSCPMSQCCSSLEYWTTGCVPMWALAAARGDHALWQELRTCVFPSPGPLWQGQPVLL